MKYYIDYRGYGKYRYPVVKRANGRKLKELENRGEELYNSSREAKEEAKKK